MKSGLILISIFCYFYLQEWFRLSGANKLSGTAWKRHKKIAFWALMWTGAALLAFFLGRGIICLIWGVQ